MVKKKHAQECGFRVWDLGYSIPDACTNCEPILTASLLFGLLLIAKTLLDALCINSRTCGTIVYSGTGSLVTL